MNKHIELVKKWLKDKSSVTAEELKANADAAYYAAGAAYPAYYAARAAHYAADAGYPAYYAARAAYDAVCAASDAESYVKKYEEITGEFGEMK